MQAELACNLARHAEEHSVTALVIASEYNERGNLIVSIATWASPRPRPRNGPNGLNGPNGQVKELREVSELREFSNNTIMLITRVDVLLEDVVLMYRYHIKETNLLSEVVRCDTSQKRLPRDSTRSTARGSLLFGMCRRLRLITTN